MSRRLGEATAKVLRDLEEIVKYYRPTECYRGGARVECYELALGLIERGYAEDDVTVCNRRKDVCLSLARGSRVAVVEVSATEVYPQVDSGDRVGVADLLAYGITSKGELRSVRSEVEGYVLLIHEDPASRPLKCYIVIAREGVVVGGGREA